jgi:hypothetical protein
MAIRDLNDLLNSIQSTDYFFDEDENHVEVEVLDLPKINLYQEDKINILIEMYNEFSLEELQEIKKQSKFNKKFVATQNRMINDLKNQAIRV